MDFADYVDDQKEIYPARFLVVASLELILLTKGLLGSGQDRLLEGADDRGCRILAVAESAADVVETFLAGLFFSGSGQLLAP